MKKFWKVLKKTETSYGGEKLNRRKMFKKLGLNLMICH